MTNGKDLGSKISDFAAVGIVGSGMMLLSYMLTAGVTFLAMHVCFGMEWSWRISTGIWLLLCLLRWTIPTRVRE